MTMKTFWRAIRFPIVLLFFAGCWIVSAAQAIAKMLMGVWEQIE